MGKPKKEWSSDDRKKKSNKRVESDCKPPSATGKRDPNNFGGPRGGGRKGKWR